MIRCIAFVWFFISCGFFVSGQEIKRFRHITINEGLAHTDATCFCQDARGFIWIGTNSGLQRFDGQQLVLFENNTSQLNKVYNNRITSLFADSHYIWVGSENGIHLFDLCKETFVELTRQNETKDKVQGPIKNITVFRDHLFFIQNNQLYEGQFFEESSLLTFSNFFATVQNLPDDFTDGEVRSLAHDQNNYLWLGTNRGIVGIRFQNEKYSYNNFWGTVDSPRSIKFDLPILVFKESKLWALGSGYLYSFQVSEQTGRYHSQIKELAINGILETRFGQSQLFEISGMAIDCNEDVWIGNLTGLLQIKSPLTNDFQFNLYESTIADPFSLTSNHISSVFEDRTNCLWVGSWGGGVSWLDLKKKKFELIAPYKIDHEINLDNTFVRAIVVDPKGIVWMGTRNKGINFYNPKTGLYSDKYGEFDINEKLTNKEVRSLAISGKQIFIGTIDGLNIYDIGTGDVTQILASDDFQENRISKSPIFNIVTDRNRNIWVATWGKGINKITRLSNGKIRVERLDSSPTSAWILSSDKINYLYFDEQKNEILASTSNGLNRILLTESSEISEVIHYRGHNGPGSFSSEYLWPIVKENDSTYWIGTLGGGLNRVELKKGKTFNNLGNYHAERFTREDGAPSNDIESMLCDDEGNLWIGGKGLSKFSTTTYEFWNFDLNDGLQSDGFKIGSAFKSDDGYLYFGGINGANYFNPSEIVKNTSKAQVAITDLKIHNSSVEIGSGKNAILTKALTYTSSVRLDYSQNNFSIGFASLHYSNPQKCRYKYILEGYDKDWHYMNADYPVANYSNLVYGTYVFKVDATNNDGIWADNPRVLTVTITPPWWRTYWAYVVYVLVFISIAYLTYYYLARWVNMRRELRLIETEEARKEELHQMKLQFFTNISHEFKTPLTLILTPIEKLIENKVGDEERESLLKMIGVNANRLNNLIKELIDFRKAETGKEVVRANYFDFENFLKETLGQFTTELESKDIAFTYERGYCEEVQLCSDQNKISKVIFNVLSNAIKFTTAGGGIFVKLFTSKKDDLNPVFEDCYEEGSEYRASRYLVLKIEDTGIGISSDSIMQIFDRFYHLKAESSNHLGSGIGLAYVRSLMMLLKGFIIVSSRRNSGTEFLLGFPLGDSHLGPDERLDQSWAQKSDLSEVFLDINKDSLQTALQQVSLIQDEIDDTKPTILIVEDNDELREVLCHHFRVNFNVLCGTNGSEALRVLDKKIPDIVLSDIMMPEMDGLEMCRKIRENFVLSHLPIVLLTARSSVDNQIEGVGTGADLYIPKPFSIRLLELQIGKLVETRAELKRKYAADIYADNREIAKNKNDQELLDHFIEFVDDRMSDENFDVDSLCRELSIGRTNLYKKIKSLTGMSMGAFIRSLRLKKAARILKSEDITISEVLYQVGISSNSYFTKSFKEQFGVTPSEFIARK